MQKTGVFDGCGANDDVAQTGVQIALDGVEIADAAAELHINFAADFLEYLADRRLVFGVTGKRAVQIHQVQAPRALVHPAARHDRRVFAESGGLVHIALFEANTVAVFEVNRRN